jgi:hypothetical protein
MPAGHHHRGGGDPASHLDAQALGQHGEGCTGQSKARGHGAMTATGGGGCRGAGAASRPAEPRPDTRLGQPLCRSGEVDLS